MSLKVDVIKKERTKMLSSKLIDANFLTTKIMCMRLQFESNVIITLF
jgi:hypothetical protein